MQELSSERASRPTAANLPFLIVTDDTIAGVERVNRSIDQRDISATGAAVIVLIARETRSDHCRHREQGRCMTYNDANSRAHAAPLFESIAALPPWRSVVGFTRAESFLS
jgi:hypothetical protein